MQGFRGGGVLVAFLGLVIDHNLGNFLRVGGNGATREGRP